MSYIWFETAIQVIGVLILAPLVDGIISKLKAVVESRKGPRILQPYYDLAKYLKKETVVNTDATAFFEIAPYFVFSIYLLIAFVIPVILPYPMK